MLDISPEVAAGLATGRPVVALESTLITHGLAYPDNLQTAQQAEQEVRAAGAIPATIAVIDGSCRVGLLGSEVEALARGGGAAKAGRRDLAACVAAGRTAGTTVAATMFLAARAGIAVFATGGIGGVHRGAERTFDISADLLELAASPVAVVCAGCKSILDIPKTLEVLETEGVLVVGYRTSRFPAFFARDSGAGLEHRCETPQDVAAVIAAQRDLRVSGGLLVANPVPAEHAMQEAEIEAVIAEAVADAEAQGIFGKAATPFLLSRVAARTAGRSVAANVALIRTNARLAAEIAVAMAART
jgi:pseudouridine-5'-phosphate glycosidase